MKDITITDRAWHPARCITLQLGAPELGQALAKELGKEGVMMLIYELADAAGFVADLRSKMAV